MKFHIALALIVCFVIGSCSDINESFTDGYSENPNDPTDAPLENLFTASEAATIAFFEGHGAWLASMWTQHSTGESRQYSGYYNYNISGRDISFGTIWETAYTDILTSLRLARGKAEEAGGRENIIAVSKIIEAMTIGTVTALWGDVPYSEAFNGAEIQNPVLDSQTDIYEASQALLDEAINSLENDPRDLPQGVDILSYEGDVEKWIKLAYTLKARFYIETSQFENAISAAQKGIRALDGSEDLYFPHGSTYQGNMNLWYSFMIFDRNGYLGASDNHAFSLMEQRENSKTDESGRQAFYYNEEGTDLNTGTDGIFAESANYAVATAAETYLILAEAYARQKTTKGETQALANLNKARQYNELKYEGSSYENLTSADFAGAGAYGSTTILQEIIDETYLSLAFQMQSFNFARRIDYQITGLQVVPGQDNFPERFLYPEVEKNANTNMPDQSNADLFNPTPVNTNN
jgi:hypothetical protein